MPKAESVLWKQIRAKQIDGIRFRRQYSIGKYIVDFYSPELLLAVEVDGDSHFMGEESIKRDKVRQSFIEKQGVSFLRFTNDDIYNRPEGVLKAIADFGKKKIIPPVLLSGKGKKG